MNAPYMARGIGAALHPIDIFSAAAALFAFRTPIDLFEKSNCSRLSQALRPCPQRRFLNARASIGKGRKYVSCTR
jgi:hypothetical protein